VEERASAQARVICQLTGEDSRGSPSPAGHWAQAISQGCLLGQLPQGFPVPGGRLLSHPLALTMAYEKPCWRDCLVVVSKGENVFCHACHARHTWKAESGLLLGLATQQLEHAAHRVWQMFGE
jgi:hypothetical protein